MPLVLPMTLVCSGNKEFLTSSRRKMKNSSYVLELLEAIKLPTILAIIKIPGRSVANTKESRGDHVADTPAKLAALKQSPDTALSSGLKEASVLPAEATGDLKNNIMEAQHSAV